VSGGRRPRARKNIRRFDIRLGRFRGGAGLRLARSFVGVRELLAIGDSIARVPGGECERSGRGGPAQERAAGVERGDRAFMQRVESADDGGWVAFGVQVRGLRGERASERAREKEAWDYK
jgi:hypothetical protein